MFFKIYFSRRKFEKDAANFMKNQNGWEYGAYCSAHDERYIIPFEAREKISAMNSIFAVQSADGIKADLEYARAELFALDTWDKNRKLRIDGRLMKIKVFLDKLFWKPTKGRGEQ